MAGTFIKLLPKELRDELDMYLLFDMIHVVTGEIYMGKRYRDISDTMIPLVLHYSVLLPSLLNLILIPMPDPYHYLVKVPKWVII